MGAFIPASAAVVCPDIVATHRYAYVDVRDLARAHVLGLTVPEAGGERFIICAGSCVMQQFGKQERNSVRL